MAEKKQESQEVAAGFVRLAEFLQKKGAVIQPSPGEEAAAPVSAAKVIPLPLMTAATIHARILAAQLRSSHLRQTAISRYQAQRDLIPSATPSLQAVPEDNASSHLSQDENFSLDE